MARAPHSIDATRHASEALAQAALWLHDGGIVGVPTESFYGLAVCAHSPGAVARLRALKGREAHKPMPLVAADGAMVAAYFEPPEGHLARLVAQMWPGPLTVGLRPKGPWPGGIMGPDGTVGVRVSAHPVLTELCRATAGLITATSANYAGGPPATRLEALPEGLLAQGFWLDGGTLPGGLPSTVVLPGPDGRVRVARLGAITRAMLEEAVGAHALL